MGDCWHHREGRRLACLASTSRLRMVPNAFPKIARNSRASRSKSRPLAPNSAPTFSINSDASAGAFQLGRRLRTSGNAFNRNSEFDYVGGELLGSIFEAIKPLAHAVGKARGAPSLDMTLLEEPRERCNFCHADLDAMLKRGGTHSPFITPPLLAPA